MLVNISYNIIIAIIAIINDWSSTGIEQLQNGIDNLLSIIYNDINVNLTAEILH